MKHMFLFGMNDSLNVCLFFWQNNTFASTVPTHERILTYEEEAEQTTKVINKAQLTQMRNMETIHFLLFFAAAGGELK